MRILAVGNMYPPHHLGGYELVWRSAMGHLHGRGHAARVLTTDFRLASDRPDEPDTHRELRWYWREHRWPRLGWRARVALERHNAAVLERHLRELRPDVVSWWAMGGMSLSLIERVRRAGLPAVAFVHDDWLRYGPVVDQWLAPFRRRPRLAAAAERLTGLPARVDVGRGARCMFVSETLRRQALSSGLRLCDSGVAHSGIDLVLMTPRPAHEWGWRLLYVGRLDERKGVSDAVAALAHLPSEATLTLAGDGEPEVRERLRALARRLGVAGRVRELGMATRPELPDIYAEADALVFPVRWEEPWGLVPLEAMAVGRPVIATGRGGSAEYLSDEDNCLLVAASDPRAIAMAADRLAAAPALRARLRDGGLQTARRYTESTFNQAVLDELTQAVSRRTTRGASGG